jgi:hypothetical protein
LSDTREKALRQLKKIIENGNLGFRMVSINPKAIEQVSPENFPLCQIFEGAAISSHELTDTEGEVIQVGIAITYKRGGDENYERSETWGRNKLDELKDLLSQNPQLNDTCDYFLASDTAPPAIWETVNEKFRYMTYLMQIRRNFGGA